MRRKTLLAGATGIVIGVLLSSAVVFAGSLNPSAGPAAPSSQMFTLEQIYTRLTSGGNATKMAAFTEPGSGPGSTMVTLDAIYALAWPARAAKTGQTATYATGDDGDLERGVAWPNPRFTDNGDGTVTDNLTGLIWLKNANCANGVRTWATALNDVASLNSTGTMNGSNCGDVSNAASHQTDWRLPSVREMHSLVHYGFVSPPVPNTAGTAKWTAGDPFTDVGSTRHFWTSTTWAGSTQWAWYQDLNDGGVRREFKTDSKHVWPVRGGQ